jgi:hypothetical protein
MSAFGSVSIVGASSSPATVTAAANGTSLSGTTVVLGNDVSGVAGAAALTANREIALEGFFLNFLQTGGVDPNQFFRIEEGVLRFATDAGGVGSIFFVWEDFGGVGSYTIEFGNPGPGAVIETQVDNVAQTVLTRSNGVLVLNGANTPGIVLVSPTTMKPFVSPETANVVLATDDVSNQYYTNEGAAAGITFSLPIATAHRIATFYIQNANGITITAQAGDTIRWGANVTAAGGSINSVTVGSSITLVGINATEWVATSLIGTWV